MIFNVIERGTPIPDSGINQVYLKIDNWNDYSFVTMFQVYIFDENGESCELGSVKIGFCDQDYSIATYQRLEKNFESLDASFFSLGTSVQYYERMVEYLSPKFRDEFLNSIRDVVHLNDALAIASEQKVFSTSHLRNVSMSEVNGQFSRVLAGGVLLTDFDFIFDRPQEEKFAGVRMGFSVTANSVPSTNIHAVIGRNGVGKTTLLNDMIKSILKVDDHKGKFVSNGIFGDKELSKDYFSSLISVSFSVFDPFNPPEERDSSELGARYYYIGMKEFGDKDGAIIKSIDAIYEEFASSVVQFFQDDGRRNRWLNAIATLESDANFADMNLSALADRRGADLKESALFLVKKMSSGHAIVLLIITKLVDKVTEKTLVILDEPESHLHPPLLSAFMRALSELLHSRNGVAVVATHSPVVLQEVPKLCVWKLTRSRLAMSPERPDIETFGENVGVLTREVFGLEVANSGYHALLAEAVSRNLTFDGVIAEYGGQLGSEAKAIVRAMISDREDGAADA